jgi:hypothetical protein
MNMYRYVHNDPVNLTDQSGLDPSQGAPIPNPPDPGIVVNGLRFQILDNPGYNQASQGHSGSTPGGPESGEIVVKGKRKTVPCPARNASTTRNIINAALAGFESGGRTTSFTRITVTVY